MYINANSVCSENPTHSCSRCAGKPPRLLFPVLSESSVRFGLKHFRPKKPRSSVLWPHMLLLLFLLLDLTVEEERSAATVHTLTQSVCCQILVLCGSAVSHVPICCILLWVEQHLFAVFKIGDIFMSLMSAPDQGCQHLCWFCMLT